MSRPIRILQVVGGMNRGGAETWLMQVLRHIDRAQFQMDFLVHDLGPYAYESEILQLGSKIIPCLSPSKPWLYAQQLHRILNTCNTYDVIHAHNHYFNALPIAVAKHSGVSGRISHHYPLTDIGTSSVTRGIYRRMSTHLLARHATALLFDSHASLAAFTRSYPRIAQVLSGVVYCGIDLVPFQLQPDRTLTRRKLGLPLNKLIVTYIGRFVPHKNHKLVLRLADRMSQASDGYHFALAGSHGPLTESLTAQARSRQDVSLFVGLSDISELLLVSDIFVFPSLEEGFGLVAIEAAAAGVPVVASDLPSIREATPPSYHSYMFPPDNDEVAAAKIQRLGNDERLRRRLGIEGKQWVQSFSIERSTSMLSDIYSLSGDPSPLSQSRLRTLMSHQT